MTNWSQNIALARRRWRGMDRLVRAMIANWIGGMCVGLTCAALLLALDVFGLRSLLWRSDIAVAGTLMLFAAFAFTFGGLVCAAAAMNFGLDDGHEPRGGGLRPRAPLAVVASRGARRPRSRLA